MRAAALYLRRAINPGDERIRALILQYVQGLLMRLERAAESISRLRALCNAEFKQTLGPRPHVPEIGEDLSAHCHGALVHRPREAQEPIPAQPVAAAPAATATSAPFMTAEVATNSTGPFGGAPAAAPHSAAPPPLQGGAANNKISPFGGAAGPGGQAKDRDATWPKRRRRRKKDSLQASN